MRIFCAVIAGNSSGDKSLLSGKVFKSLSFYGHSGFACMERLYIAVRYMVGYLTIRGLL